MNNLFSQREEQGFVSLFTCILISILLVIITLSIVSIEALQLRKAEDAEQSVRAYYAAEAGVEDAAAKVLSGAVTSNQGCTQNLAFDVSGDAGWTCQQISFSGAPFGRLLPDVAQTVNPGPANYQSAIIEWGDNTSNGANYYNVPATQTLPPQSAYAYEPSVELSVVQYPNSNFNAQTATSSGALKLQNALLVPAGTTGSGVVNYSTGLLGQGPYRAQCGPLPRTDPLGQTQYNCYMILSNLNPASNYLFRIRSRYGPGSYQMTFMSGNNGTGSVVAVPSGVATIDVTAKAGQVYRRVLSELPINQSAAGELNYVMYSDTSICKNFNVVDNVEQGGCPY